MGKSIHKNPVVTNPHTGLGNENPQAVKPRDAVQNGGDPYLPDEHWEDGTVCVRCGAVYENQHWNLDRRRAETLVSAGAPHQIVCPGCRKIEERNPHGVVTLSGDYWQQHRDDILNLVYNEEARGVRTNPLERIIDVREEGERLVIETTNEKLAQKIGRAIHSAHKGTIEYQWPDTNRLLRVEWSRSAEPASPKR